MTSVEFAVENTVQKEGLFTKLIRVVGIGAAIGVIAIVIKKGIEKILGKELKHS
jgi:hypothetical protein